MSLGIRQIFRLGSSQAVAASTVLVDLVGTAPATLTPITFPISAAAIGQKLHYRIKGGFTLGATGGFKFRLDGPASTNYQNSQTVTDGVTASPGAIIANCITALADFANALAVAGNHQLDMEGDFVPSAAGNLKLQFACNSAANGITVLQGLVMEVTIV